MNDLLWNMEKQCVTPLVAIDLSAAFDTVDHPILLSVLEKRFGICDKVLAWFDTYLKPRSLKVCVNEMSLFLQIIHYSLAFHKEAVLALFCTMCTPVP